MACEAWFESSLGNLKKNKNSVCPRVRAPRPPHKSQRKPVAGKQSFLKELLPGNMAPLSIISSRDSESEIHYLDKLSPLL
jgi:hypothetical protein